MKITCPKCDREIAAADVNIQTNVMLCRACNEMFPLIDGDLPEGSVAPESFDLASPPSGAWYESGVDGETVEARCFSLGGVMITFIFAAMFGGIPLAVMTGWLDNHSGSNSAPIWFLSIFVLIGAVAACACLLKFLGKTTATVSASGCEVFTGIGPFGWHRFLALGEIECVTKVQCGTTNNKPSYQIALQKVGGGLVRFGMFLPDERQEYLRCATITLLERYQEQDKD